jgi:hypothetical protein
MDLDGYEYSVMRLIIDSGTHIPLQIAMQIHLTSMEDRYIRAKSSAELLSFMGYLHEFGGYSLIDRRDHPSCHHCSDVLLARIDCTLMAPFDVRASPLWNQHHPALSESLRYVYPELLEIGSGYIPMDAKVEGMNTSAAAEAVRSDVDLNPFQPWPASSFKEKKYW